MEGTKKLEYYVRIDNDSEYDFIKNHVEQHKD